MAEAPFPAAACNPITSSRTARALSLPTDPNRATPEVEAALNDLLDADEALRNAEDEEDAASLAYENALDDGADVTEVYVARTSSEVAYSNLLRARRQVREAQARYDREVRESRSSFIRTLRAVWNHYVGGGNNSPEPGAGNDLPGADHEDPRCAGKRVAAGWGVPWQDMCRKEDGTVDLIA